MNEGYQYGWRRSLTAFIMKALMLENASPVRSIACKIAALLDVEQTGRPGVGHVGQQFQALVAQRGDPRRPLRRRDVSSRRWC